MTKRIYTFAVYITAPIEHHDGEGFPEGYTAADVEYLLKTTLAHYSGPLNKEHRSLDVDFELMSVESVQAAETKGQDASTTP